ncbi:MAG TPA: WecB/TagA/CpsF family glycosyltransferase [Symbiobacteriaceae bacterium]|nr:WecB/TagA/CpsF family glycosyltransferase [Symbiobacteriaceae bacterium]
MSRARILSIGVDKVTMDEAVDRCIAFSKGDEPRMVVTPNAEISYRATREPDLAALINQADLVIPDGAGVVIASRILGDPVPERVAGTDLSTKLVARMSQQGRGRVYILGGAPGVAARAAAHLTGHYPGIRVVGHHHGFFKPEEEAGVIASIRAAETDVLFVGMGSPRQEQWIARHKHEHRAKVSLGVGGTIDVWAGTAQRAPEWMRRANLEWLFRIVKLGRVGRSLPPLAKFGLLVMARRMRGR